MSKKVGVVAAAIVLTVLSGAWGLDNILPLDWTLPQAPPGGPQELGATLGVRYLSSYIYRGFDIYGPGSHSAIQPYTVLDFWGTGFGASILWSRANGDGYENWEGLTYSLFYQNSAWSGAPYATNYTVGWRWYNFPDGPVYVPSSPCHDRDLDHWEFFGIVSLPEVCPAGVVPYYELIYISPAEGGRYLDGCNHSWFRDAAGFIHNFGLAYDWAVPGLLPDVPEQTIRLFAEATYNDHAGGNYVDGGDKVDHDWSHCTFGATTEFPLDDQCVLEAGVFHQHSMDDSVNTQEETWFMVGAQISTR